MKVNKTSRYKHFAICQSRSISLPAASYPTCIDISNCGWNWIQASLGEGRSLQRKLACCVVFWPHLRHKIALFKLFEREELKHACCVIYVTRLPYLKLFEREELKLACCAVTPVMSQDHPILNSLKQRSWNLHVVTPFMSQDRPI